MKTRRILFHQMAPPNPAFVMRNFDGFVAKNKATSGFVIHDENGCPLTSGARSLGEFTILVAEALALRDAFNFARQKGF